MCQLKITDIITGMSDKGGVKMAEKKARQEFCQAFIVNQLRHLLYCVRSWVSDPPPTTRDVMTQSIKSVAARYQVAFSIKSADRAAPSI